LLAQSLELKITLSPSQQGPVSKWLANFCENEPNWAEPPELEGRLLKISALCFPFFLGYVKASDSNEFDIQRLRKSGMQQIRSRLAHPSDLQDQRTLRYALDNLGFIEVGEFIEGEIGLSGS
jgi:hypothetical protein